MKNKKGITLVSLVVTIIVLIILAGVSINLTLGENGIITMAKRARENMELAKVDEERQLNELYMQMEQEGVSGEISYDAITKLVEFKRQIASAITDMGIDTPENADASTMSTNIRSITGASSADKVTYDNTNCTLAATNVQGAVDELDENLGRLGDCELIDSIVRTGAWNGEQVTKACTKDLSKYRYIIYCISNGESPSIKWNTGMFPVSVVRNGFGSVRSSWNYDSILTCGIFDYIDDTNYQIHLSAHYSNNNPGTTLELYVYGIY